MNRKMVSLLLVVMLMLTAVVYAEGVNPSKNSGAMTQVVLPPNVPPSFSVDIKTETQFSKEVFEQFDTFLKDGGNVIEYFPTETMQEIEAQLPAGFDTSKLQINEFMPLAMTGIEDGMSDLTLKFEFPTTYEKDADIVTLVGVVPEEGEDTEWIVTPSEVDDEGKLDITFTVDTLTKVASGDAVLTVLTGTPSETTDTAE